MKLGATKNNIHCACGECKWPDFTPCYSVSPNQEFKYLDFEEMTGNLRDLNIKKMGHSQRIELIKQIANGVNELHTLGIIHRDLKPENILYKKSVKEYILKICDYGWSYIGENTSELRKYKKSHIVTFAYRPPEAFGDVYSNKIDIWSFGCIAYEILYDEKLFNFEKKLKDFIETQYTLYFSIDDKKGTKRCLECGAFFIPARECLFPLKLNYVDFQLYCKKCTVYVVLLRWQHDYLVESLNLEHRFATFERIKLLSSRSERIKKYKFLKDTLKYDMGDRPNSTKLLQLFPSEAKKELPKEGQRKSTRLRKKPYHIRCSCIF
jgi:serine/threonine protein kinase